MFRLVYKTFHGEPRNHEIHAHESPKVMLVPLVILATLAIVAGYVGTPFANAVRAQHRAGAWASISRTCLSTHLQRHAARVLLCRCS